MNCELNAKIDLNGEKIRFMLKGETSMLLTELQKKVENSFGVECGFLLKYQDDEGDFITIATESDLEMAMKLNPEILRLVVDPKQVQVQVQQEEEKEQEEQQNKCIPTKGVKSANFLMKNHKMVMINLNSEKMDLLGLSNISDDQLTEKLKKWTLKELITVGLVTKDHALELCQQNGVKPPRCCFHESSSSPSSLLLFKKKKDHGSFRISDKKKNHNKKKSHHHHHHHHHGRHHQHHHRHHRNILPEEHMQEQENEQEQKQEKEKERKDHHHHHKHDKQMRLKCKCSRKGGERRYRIWKEKHDTQQKQEILLNKLSALSVTENQEKSFSSAGQNNNNGNNDENLCSNNNFKKRTETSWYDRNIKIARFLQHVNYPRNHIITTPGETIQKIWRMKNDSTISWSQNCEIVFHKGNSELSIPTVTPISAKEVPPGSEVDISVSIVTPTKCGYYQASWRLRDKTEGKMFGESVWTSFIVKNQTANHDADDQMQIEQKSDRSQENVFTSSN